MKIVRLYCKKNMYYFWMQIRHTHVICNYQRVLIKGKLLFQPDYGCNPGKLICFFNIKLLVYQMQNYYLIQRMHWLLWFTRSSCCVFLCWDTLYIYLNRNVFEITLEHYLQQFSLIGKLIGTLGIGLPLTHSLKYILVLTITNYWFDKI